MDATRTLIRSTVALCFSIAAVFGSATSEAAEPDGEGAYFRVGLGLGVGQDFRAAGIRPIPGLGLVLGLGYAVLPDLAGEITAHILSGLDVFAPGPLTIGGDEEEDSVLGQIGVYPTVRANLVSMPENTYTTVGIGFAGAGRDVNLLKTGVGALVGVGWEVDADTTNTYGAGAHYTFGLVGDPIGAMHAVTFVAHGSFGL